MYKFQDHIVTYLCCSLLSYLVSELENWLEAGIYSYFLILQAKWCLYKLTLALTVVNDYMLSKFKQHACSTHFKIQFQHHLENHVDNNKLSFICRVVSNHQKLFSFPMLYGSRGYSKKNGSSNQGFNFCLDWRVAIYWLCMGAFGQQPEASFGDN